MNTKNLLFAILIFLNSVLLHAQNASDTINTVHDEDVVFPEYNSDAEIFVLANNRYVDKRRKHHRSVRYNLSLSIEFSSTISPASYDKIVNRLRRNYKLSSTMINFFHDKPRYVSKFRTVEIIRMYSYVCRIEITDLFNSKFKTYGLKIENGSRR